MSVKPHGIGSAGVDAPCHCPACHYADPTDDGSGLHEWQCPCCGATTRARMADHPTGDGAPDTGELREQIARTLYEVHGYAPDSWETPEMEDYGGTEDVYAEADKLLAGPLAPLLAALD